jgi:putative transcriptional regulator
VIHIDNKKQNQSNRQIVSRTRFRELRLKKNLTQLELAAEFGVTETTIRNLESGRTNPSLENLFAFARYFETDVYDLWPDIAGERFSPSKIV